MPQPAPESNDVEDVDGLRHAVDQLCDELKALSRRVGVLATAVEQLHGPNSGNPTRPGRRTPASPPLAPARAKLERVAVMVRPLPELAMAAMAETSLHDLPGVSEVVSSERVEDRVRFTLEVEVGTDLVAEMRQAMPVRFTVVEDLPGEISVELHWAWGTSG